jgi:hypothetical protein
LVRIKDSSKSYSPESFAIFDIPTALAFFATQPEETKNEIGEKVRDLTKKWNKKYKNSGPQVKTVYY